MKIKLYRNSRGYIPEGFEHFADYKPVTYNYILVHDIMEHQPNEKGGWENELRAVGAHFRYTKNPNVGKTIKNWENRLLKSAEIWIREGMPRKKRVYPCFRNILKNEDLIYKDYFLTKLSEGMEYASQFTPKAWLKIRRTDFAKYHAEGKELIVDKASGNIEVL